MSKINDQIFTKSDFNHLEGHYSPECKSRIAVHHYKKNVQLDAIQIDYLPDHLNYCHGKLIIRRP